MIPHDPFNDNFFPMKKKGFVVSLGILLKNSFLAPRRVAKERYSLESIRHTRHTVESLLLTNRNGWDKKTPGKIIANSL